MKTNFLNFFFLCLGLYSNNLTGNFYNKLDFEPSFSFNYELTRTAGKNPGSFKGEDYSILDQKNIGSLGLNFSLYQQEMQIYGTLQQNFDSNFFKQESRLSDLSLKNWNHFAFIGLEKSFTSFLSLGLLSYAERDLRTFSKKQMSPIRSPSLEIQLLRLSTYLGLKLGFAKIYLLTLLQQKTNSNPDLNEQNFYAGEELPGYAVLFEKKINEQTKIWLHFAKNKSLFNHSKQDRHQEIYAASLLMYPTPIMKLRVSSKFYKDSSSKSILDSLSWLLSASYQLSEKHCLTLNSELKRERILDEDFSKNISTHIAMTYTFKFLKKNYTARQSDFLTTEPLAWLF